MEEPADPGGCCDEASTLMEQLRCDTVDAPVEHMLDKHLGGIDSIVSRHCASILKQLEALTSKQEAFAEQVRADRQRNQEMMEKLATTSEAVETPRVRRVTSVGPRSVRSTKVAPTSPLVQLPKTLTPDLAADLETVINSVEDTTAKPVVKAMGAESVNQSESVTVDIGAKNSVGGTGGDSSMPGGALVAWSDKPSAAKADGGHSDAVEPKKMESVLPGALPAEVSYAIQPVIGSKEENDGNTKATQMAGWKQLRETNSKMLNKRLRAQKTSVCFDASVSFFSREGVWSSIHRFTTSRRFETFSTCVIVLNALFVGLQIQVASAEGEDFNQYGVGWVVAEVVFLTLFSIELVLRAIAQGTDFIFGLEWGWNVFDSCVVLMSAVQLLLDAQESAPEGMENVSFMRLIRLVRIARVLRVIKVIRFFRELRMMIASIVSSIQSLVWSMCVLLICFYMFGACLTIGALDYVRKYDLWHSTREDVHVLLWRFGSLDRSILSLFKAMCGGVDWGDLLDDISMLPWVYGFLFLVYISFATFAVVNIVTGVFVENAMSASMGDKEAIIQNQEIEREAFLVQMHELFAEVDSDRSGFITEKEFLQYLNNDRAMAYFHALKLEVDEVRLLFRLLDCDGSGSVEIDEFLMGCRKLSGESRAIDLHILQLEVKWLMYNFAHFVEGTADENGEPGQLASSLPRLESATTAVMPNVAFSATSGLFD